MATPTVVRAELERLFLTSQRGFVAALEGSWGSGKTHLWNEIRPSLETRARVLYASLFGVESLESVRAALLSDVFSTQTQGEDDSWWKRRARTLTRNLPTIFQVLDDKIGGPLLAKAVDPLVLIPERSIFCLDDIERTTNGLCLADVLGFATTLAERRGAMVLLIYNDDHLLSRLREQEVAFQGTYRERAITTRLSLTCNVGEIAKDLPQDAYPLLSPDEKDLVIRVLTQAGSQNLRTLFRVLERCEQCKQVLGEYFLSRHITLVTALSVEHAEGLLKPADFYSFEPLAVMFHSHSMDSEHVAPQNAERLRFFGRFFEPNEEYRFSYPIYQLISEGAVEPHSLYEDGRSEIARKEGPLYSLLAQVDDQSLHYFSDEEHREWQRGAVEKLSSEQAILACNIMRLATGLEVSYHQLGEGVPQATWHLLEAQLTRAAESGDASLNESYKVVLTSPRTRALMEGYRAGLERASMMEARDRLLAAIAAEDELAVLHALRTDFSKSLTAACDLSVLKAIHATFRFSRRFYFSTILSFCEAASRHGRRDVLECLESYVVACRLFENLDVSDRHRFDQLGRHLERA